MPENNGEQIQREAVLLAISKLSFKGNEGENVDVNKLTFLTKLDGDEKAGTDIKVFYTKSGENLKNPSFNDLAKGKAHLGVLTYAFQKAWSANQSKDVWKPKFISFE